MSQDPQLTCIHSNLRINVLHVSRYLGWRQVSRLEIIFPKNYYLLESQMAEATLVTILNPVSWCDQPFLYPLLKLSVLPPFFEVSK